MIWQGWLPEREWLTTTGSVEEIEASCRNPERPFGQMTAEWEAFKGRLQPGDELWWFISPRETWRRGGGREGVVMVRAGRMVECLLTRLS